MGKLKNEIKKALINRGFTGDIKLFFWPNDGWYGHCDQFQHIWLGQHSKHSVEQIKEGFYDEYLDP